MPLHSVVATGAPHAASVLHSGRAAQYHSPKAQWPLLTQPRSCWHLQSKGFLGCFRGHGTCLVQPGTDQARITAAVSPAPSKLAKPVRPEVEKAILETIGNCVTKTDLHEKVPGLGPKKEGKVRDQYDAGDKLLIVTTDRQSAFDRLLAAVPFKGQVLNQTSAWWFRKTKHLVPNAHLASPDPCVTIFKKCKVFPVEFVVRGYVTGTTSTSLWTVYSKGVRNYCGNELPEGLKKNDRLQFNIVTPTTKAEDHDEPVTPDEIVERGLMTQEDYNYVADRALALFAYGQGIAASHGLLLVDTKYEFGRAEDGTIHLVDEVHTPDSSRYWVASTYAERHKQGQEPENIDKEFLRLWFKDNCDPYNDAVLPEAPKELVAELSRRYILLFETITATKFNLPDVQEPVEERIARNVTAYLAKQQQA